MVGKIKCDEWCEAGPEQPGQVRRQRRSRCWLATVARQSSSVGLLPCRATHFRTAPVSHALMWRPLPLDKMSNGPGLGFGVTRAVMDRCIYSRMTPKARSTPLGAVLLLTALGGCKAVVLDPAADVAPQQASIQNRGGCCDDLCVGRSRCRPTSDQPHPDIGGGPSGVRHSQRRKRKTGPVLSRWSTASACQSSWNAWMTQLFWPASSSHWSRPEQRCSFAGKRRAGERGQRQVSRRGDRVRLRPHARRRPNHRGRSYHWGDRVSADTPDHDEPIAKAGIGALAK
jgi:hypothetical protein